MLTKTLELSLPGQISDAVLLGEQIFAAVGWGLVIIEHERAMRVLDIPVESIVTSDDAKQILAVSQIMEIAPDLPRRRHVHQVTFPFAKPQDLGIASVEGFSKSYDGQYWPTYEGDDVHLFECTEARLDIAAHYATDWPIHIERIPQGIWLEVSSLGANHFQILSMPDLHVMEDGTFRYLDTQFPPETISFPARAPTLAQPIAAINAAGCSTTRNVSIRMRQRCRKFYEGNGFTAVADVSRRGVFAAA